MHPVCFEWGGHTVYWYGVLFAGGFLATIIHWSIMARHEGWPSGFGLELGLWFMVSSVIGARLAFVLSEAPVFFAEPMRIFRLDQGGLIFYGGALGATLGLYWLARLRRIALWKMADFTILAIPLGHAIGRVGCLLNGCCYGSATTLWWGIPLHGTLRHPVPLLETTYNLCLYIILLKVYRHKHRNGRVFALYLMLYPAMRFFVEFLRGDPRMPGLVFDIAQELSLLFFLLGVTLWWVLPKKRLHNHEYISR